MKFLLALSLLASTAAFANEHGRDYKCWDTAQERQEYPTYVFEVERYHPAKNNYLQVELEYPKHIELERKHDCWVGRDEGPTTTETKHGDWFKVCEGEGQSIRGLIPVEIEEENFEGTVYCERGLGRIFKHHGHDDDMLN